MEQTLLVLSPDLVDKIKWILVNDVDIPQKLRRDLQASIDGYDTALRNPTRDTKGQLESETEGGEGGSSSEGDEEDTVEETIPPTIEIESIERLASWSTTLEGEKRIRKAKLDPDGYALIPLLASTRVYIPPSRLALLKSSDNPDKPNPYLPSHLSPREGPLSGYKALNKQISTILNILFSIIGSGGAVYVASTGGAGFSKEKSIILGILASCVVGLAEIILIWIFVWRVQEARQKEVEQWKGSSARGVKEPEVDKVDDQGADDPSAQAVLVSQDREVERKANTDIRLRRRAIKGEKTG